MRAGAVRRWTSRRSASRGTAGSMSRCIIGSASMPGTGCSTWRAGPGWPSSWLGYAALCVPVLTPRPGWSRWPGTAIPDLTSGPAICTRCRGTRRRSMWSPASGESGVPARAPFRLAAADKSGNQAVMVSLGRPGVGEQLLASHGFVDVQRLEVPFAWEFADPEVYARALAATGPAYEAIQNVGEAEFHRAAVEQAQGQLRDGLPLRAEINVVGYLARKPEAAELV